MHNITRSKDKIAEIMEEKPYKLLHEGKYKEAYASLLHLKSKDKNLDKVNFALGFICELGVVEGTNFKLAESYYAKAIELGSIEAKVRMALMAEKGKILDLNTAYNLYNEVIEYYNSHNEQLSDGEAKYLANNAAFAYYRLGRMYEKSIFITEAGVQENKLKSLESYDLSLSLYNKHQINNLCKARVLNRIGWIKYEILLEEDSWQDIEKTQKELENIKKIFNEADKLGNRQAKLGFLNIQAAKYSLIDNAPGRNITQAKSSIKEALSIDPNHLPTLLLAARIETIALATKDHKLALGFIRKALELAPNDERVKRKFDEVIGFQSRNFAMELNKHLKIGIEEIIGNAAKRGASQETIDKSQKLQAIFYPKEYNSANWVIKQTYSQALLDKNLEKNTTQFTAIVTDVIRQNKLFRELYEPADQESLAKQVVKDLMESDDLSLMILIVTTDKMYQTEQDQLDQRIANQFELFYNTKEKAKTDNLLLTKEEHQWVSSQEEFIKLFCNKFIEERNTIEAIAKDKALPLKGKVGKLNGGVAKIGLLLNAPPFSYLGNALGITTWTTILATFTADYVHSQYQEIVISGFVATDKLLPRREEANEIISDIAKEFASIYSVQIANIKDSESLKIFAELTIERMMSHAFAQTGIVKQIQNIINNKVNSALDFVLGNGQELKPLNARKLLYEGIWYGKSSSANNRIRTNTEKREFEDNWEANELLERPGVITKDKRIFGNIKNIEKYGCARGNEIDVTIRRLQPIDQSKLSSELKSKLNKAHEKQEKLHSTIEQILASNRNQPDSINKTPTTHNNYNTVLAKAIIGIGAAFLLLSLAVMYIPLLGIASSFVPGLIAAGGLLTVTGIIFGRNTKDNTTSELNINETQVNHKDIATTEKEVVTVKIDKIKGPTPLDNYNDQTLLCERS